MKKYSIYLALVMLILASLACQTVLGGGSSNTQEELPPFEYSEPETQEGSSTESDEFDFSFGGDSDFPMPADASNVMSIAGTTNFQTKLSLDEALQFYRDEYGRQGLTERDLLTVVSDGVFSMVFDGHPSGQAVVIQGVDLGDGSVNISITLQDI